MNAQPLNDSGSEGSGGCPFAHGEGPRRLFGPEAKDGCRQLE